MQIGPRIQTLRRSRGWTQEQLAQALKVSRQAVSKWEAGRPCRTVQTLWP